MRIAALSLLIDGAPPLETFVEHNRRQLDLLVFGCPPGSEGHRDVLARFQALGLPVLVFDLPPETAVEIAGLPALLSNLERFFRLDAVVLLEADELVEEGSRRRLEREVQCLAPRGVTEIQVTSLDRETRASRLVRLGDRPANVSSWRSAVEARGASRLRQDRPPVPDPPSRSGGERPATTSRREEGIWDADLHRSNFYLDVPPFRFVLDKYRPDSVLDLGCGLGGYPELFRRRGVSNVLGIDGFEPGDDLVCPLECYRQADLREPLRLGTRFELVISTEVIEHLDERHEEVFLDNVERHAQRLILFSAARPGQPGIGHVNCKPIEHWLAAWEKRGWMPSHFDTCAVRSLSTFFWFRRNLVLLVRRSAVGELSREYESCPAGEVEIQTAKWFGQQSRVCRTSFSEPLPELFSA